MESYIHIDMEQNSSVAALEKNLVDLTMATMNAAQKVVNVKIISDIVWPFCYIGLRNLERASEASGIPFKLMWEPFMLNPQMKEDGEYIWDHLSKKYGPNAKKRFGGANSFLNQAGREVGIHFNSERFIYPTVRAHALMEYVKNTDNEKANMLMVEMYREYFEEGANINNADVLSRITGKTLQNNLDQVNEALDAMENESMRNQVISKDRKAKDEMNVHGVPYFIIERNDGNTSIEFSGAQPSDIIAEQLEIAAEEK